MEKQVIKTGKFSAEYFVTDIENGSEEVKEWSPVIILNGIRCSER